ncbi:MAG: hypothetical protein JOZ75_08220, partial [Candidatus Dormibacteraeota bacterium]|nr:hypothetical protein [Candidatus Dormibacteraeota bacterium]
DNPINVVRATVAALASLKTLQEVADLRGISPERVIGGRRLANQMLGREPALAEARTSAPSGGATAANGGAEGGAAAANGGVEGGAVAVAEPPASAEAAAPAAPAAAETPATPEEPQTPAST